MKRLAAFTKRSERSAHAPKRRLGEGGCAIGEAGFKPALQGAARHGCADLYTSIRTECPQPD